MKGFGFIENPNRRYKSDWEGMSVRLRNAIVTHTHARKLEYKKDAKHFANIFVIDGVPPKQIKKVLKWYCKQLRHGDVLHSNTQFIPKATTGQVFRDKYIYIYHAMIKIEGDTSKKMHPRWKKFAKELHVAYAKHRKSKRKNPTRVSAEAFEALHTQDGVTKKEIRQILKWYCNAVQDADSEELIYLPHATNGMDFRRKFTAIENARRKNKVKRRREKTENPDEDFTVTTKEIELTKSQIAEHKKKLGW